MADWDKVTEKLVGDTINGSIVWKASCILSRPQHETVLSPFYRANIAGHIVLVYEYVGRNRTNVAIEFITDGGICLFAWPVFGWTIERKLIQTIRSQIAKIDDFLKKFLA
jgi:hypothetical protein